MLAIVFALASCAGHAYDATGFLEPGFGLGQEADGGAGSTQGSGSTPQGESGSEQGELPPEVPRPDFMRNVPYMPDQLLRNKPEGMYVTGFPAVGVDDIEGVVVGAQVQWFNNGPRDGPFFRSTPYRSRIGVAAAFTSNDVKRFIGAVDFPYAFGSPYRVRGGLILQDIPVNRYFGVGEETLGPLSFPGAPGQTFSTYDSYKSALKREQNGVAWTKYDEWRSRTFDIAFTIERDLAGGIVRPLIGMTFRHQGVEDYTGTSVTGVNSSGQEVPATQAPTHLYEDAQSGSISGFDGGWDNFLKLGITVDTRDFEPDPNAGILGMLTTTFSTKWLGSNFDYQRVTTSLTGYFSPIPKVTRLILAARGLYSMQFGNVPFFSMNRLAFTTRDAFGLGSFRTLRGYKQNRFIGNTVALLNTEARWYFLDFKAWTQHLQLGVNAHFDTGRVFDDVDFSLEDWRYAYGGGFMIAWNLATVIRFDLTASSEDKIFFLEVGHPF